MITDSELKQISRLKHEPGYILLCDYLQSFIDSMADGMAADDLTSDARLQRVHEWRAARKFLVILKNYPEELSAAFRDSNHPEVPEELSIDHTALASMLAKLK